MRASLTPAPVSPPCPTRALCGPLALAACLHLLAATAFLVTWCLAPPTPPVRWLAQRLYHRPPPARASVIVTVYLVQRPDGSYLAVDDSGSGDPIAALAQNDSSRVVEGVYWEAAWSKGLWAPWYRAHIQTIELRGLHQRMEPASSEQASLAREAFADWFERTGAHRYASRVREGTLKRIEFVWWGPALDVFTALLLVCTGASGYAMVRTARDARRAASLQQGLCPSCRYELGPDVQTAGDVRCPECGSLWTL